MKCFITTAWQNDAHKLWSRPSKMEALKRLQAETAAKLGGLLPAILDKAFKGELSWMLKAKR
jgi:hypothetical protein